MANAASAVQARELDPRAVLPYARHATDQVIALDTSSLHAVVPGEALSFETADIRDLNDWHGKLNGAWRNLASDRLAIWHHLIRRVDDRYPAGRFRSTFAADLDAAYRARIGREQLYVNELYVSLVLHPGRSAEDRAQALTGRLASGWGRPGPADDSELEQLRILTEAGRDLAQYLARYQPAALGLIERGGVLQSEPLRVLRLVLTGRDEPVPLVRGHLGDALYTSRRHLRARGPGDPGRNRNPLRGRPRREEYPATTRPGLWDSLLSAAFPFV